MVLGYALDGGAERTRDIFVDRDRASIGSGLSRIEYLAAASASGGAMSAAGHASKRMVDRPVR